MEAYLANNDLFKETICAPINGIMLNLITFEPLWAWQNLWGYGRKVHAKFWPWGMPWDPIYDHLRCV